ncbi:MAG TPA: hypothetical protein P5309_04295 [Syntrophomonadaceae bacterium]|nr:hypothetical protein [Syntrophomonadaceae bacterium]
MEKDLLGVPISIIDTDEYKELEKREYAVGPDQLMDEILAKRLFTNAEIMWVVRRMVYFYGRRDALLKITPPDRLLMNMNSLLRAFYILFDLENPEMDDNIRSYLSSRLTDATWGTSKRTREYLYKIN